VREREREKIKRWRGVERNKGQEKYRENKII
jgi:hypothetical protein